MKTTSCLSLPLAIGLAFSTLVCSSLADQPTPGAAKKAKSAQISVLPSESTRKAAGNNRFNPATGSIDGKETGTLTGSHLKSTYTVRGHSTDAAQPVYVIERGDPRFTSRSTVGGVLRNLPFGTVRGY